MALDYAEKCTLQLLAEALMRMMSPCSGSAIACPISIFTHHMQMQQVVNIYMLPSQMPTSFGS